MTAVGYGNKAPRALQHAEWLDSRRHAMILGSGIGKLFKERFSPRGPAVDIPIRHQRIIDELRRRGLVADFRRWAMGDTIQVAEMTVQRGELEELIRSLYLYPAGENLWIIDPCWGNTESPPMVEAQILECVERMVRSDDVFERQSKYWYAQNEWHAETKRRCPECGSPCPENRRKCYVCGGKMERTEWPPPRRKAD